MKKVFFGHRGVGKTSLLKRHQSYSPSVAHFDLDHFIAESEKKSISEIFQKQGEAEFRQLEQSYFKKLTIENETFVISVGAGFDVSALPAEFEKVFVSRTTDEEGRIFLDRPRLNIELSALEEYQFRYHQRQVYFTKFCDWIYDLPEGLKDCDIERQIFSKQAYLQKAYLTIAPQDFKYLLAASKVYSSVELKDETLSFVDVLQNQLKNFKRILISYRQSKLDSWPRLKKIIDSELKDVQVDVDLDVSLVAKLDDPSLHELKSNLTILSSHIDNITENLNQLQQASVQFSKKLHLKCCPLISSFEELIEGDQWMLADPQNRSFLPRSSDGQWVWYRLFRADRLKLNFVKGSSRQNDQPSLHQFLEFENLSQKSDVKEWAAVIGSPVYFSRSPEFHRKYFNSKNCMLLAIHIFEPEFEMALEWLAENNFSSLAITAPLKIKAYEAAGKKTELALQLKSVNTLSFLKSQKTWSGDNTDVIGFHKLIEIAKVEDSNQVGLWGGSGTWLVMKKILPQSVSFSSRSGEIKSDLSALGDYAPENQDQIEAAGRSLKTLVWAAPRHLETKMPPLHWPIQKVIDLNYRENSLGLEYAQNLKSKKHQIQYYSGLEMFEKQGEAQQKFWSENESK